VRGRPDPIAHDLPPFTTIADFGAKRAFFGPIRPKDAPLAV
jgi:hypothetical protein